MDDKQLHLGGHDQVNVTWRLVVHVELITGSLTPCLQDLSDMISSHSIIHIDK